MRKLITPLAISAALFFASQSSFAQGVGINTTQPDASAALDITGTDKGLLIPRVSLQSLTDNTTVSNPATALLVYNTNAGLGKVGFYYNSGTPANPAWSLINGGGSLTLPFSQLGTNNGPLFLINNNDANGTSVGISGIAANAIGVRGATLSGKGVVGHSASGGTGVFASAANVNGKALEVSGPITIAGPGQSPGSGKVLTSDDNGNATWQTISGDVAFRANGVLGGGNQNIALGATAKVVFENEVYDLNQNYNNANSAPNSTFIAPVNGVYHFDLNVAWKKPLDVPSFYAETHLVRTRGGVKVVIASDFVHSEVDNSSKLSTEVNLLAGDMMHVEVKNPITEGGIQLFTTAEHSFFNGRLVIKQ
ncbi:hypothetical protein LZG74_03905 [Dyadobacter sp. CY327]|uniref:hypothetical protein n=1 Tax=Dyadobacter sp. CY327 TaxID=2907301 RepID=UPI001F1A7784|nr:hypothetical protein [Dyadobacter sp. CY327]MCE7069430.1 hypothetical protein [Dyadobacter sp. CY327]